MIVANELHLRSVSIENAIVVSLYIMSKDVMKLRCWLVAISGASLLSHLDTTIRHESALKWLVGLQTYDSLKIFEIVIDISRSIGIDAGNNVCFHVEHTTLSSFFCLQFLQHIPELACSLCWFSEELFISIERCIVVLDEISNIYFVLPKGLLESLPFCSHK